MIFFILQKVLFLTLKVIILRNLGGPNSLNGCTQQQQYYKISKNSFRHLYTICSPFFSHVSHVPAVTCSMSGFMRHMSLVTNNNDHIHKPSPPNFPIINNRLIHRGVAQKRKKKSLKLIKLKKISKIVSFQAKISNMSFWCFAMAHTNRLTHTHIHTHIHTCVLKKSLTKNQKKKMFLANVFSCNRSS